MYCKTRNGINFLPNLFFIDKNRLREEEQVLLWSDEKADITRSIIV